MHNIVEMNHNQAESLAKVISSSFKTVALQFGLNKNNCPTHPSNCISDWIKYDFENKKKYFGLFENNQIIGCVCFELNAKENQICYLGRLCVLPEFRNKGYGNLLIKYFEHYAKQQKCTKIEIGIIKKHIKLKEYYITNGFKEMHSQIYEHLPFEVLFMQKELV